jgi:hypothetical protein
MYLSFKRLFTWNTNVALSDSKFGPTTQNSVGQHKLKGFYICICVVRYKRYKSVAISPQNFGLHHTKFAFSVNAPFSPLILTVVISTGRNPDRICPVHGVPDERRQAVGSPEPSGQVLMTNIYYVRKLQIMYTRYLTKKEHLDLCRYVCSAKYNT